MSSYLFDLGLRGGLLDAQQRVKFHRVHLGTGGATAATTATACTARTHSHAASAQQVSNSIRIAGPLASEERRRLRQPRDWLNSRR